MLTITKLTKKDYVAVVVAQGGDQTELRKD
jgi:hypothetical protein